MFDFSQFCGQVGICAKKEKNLEYSFEIYNFTNNTLKQP